jgi:mannosylglycerate hydrolase
VPEPRIVHLVPHTHWDREWYLPFQSFRLRLVGLIDRLLGYMDADERFVFTLDGQLATVDDYLEVRPEAEERIRSLVEAGRLAIGPWHVLMDEFLVSGESIVRNLELGLARAEALGGALSVGYLPDQFGHVAQMPQILHRAGIDDAAVWRGVPAEIDRHVFRWTAPDGSAVRAEYLPQGYWNAAHLLAIPDRVAAKVKLLDETLRPFFGDDEVLALYGTDHAEPSAELVELVVAANAADNGYRLDLTTLAGYFSHVRGTDGGQTGDSPASVPGTRLEWTGELRSGARANLLPGVVSARIDLKVACARAERLLERYAEPLQALWGERWPSPLLELAWRRVIESSAHDSICGCSADAVCRQVLVRLEEAEQIAAGLAGEAAATVARRVPRGWTAVLNPSPHPRSELVEVDVAVPEDWEDVSLALPDGTPIATQELGRSEPLVLTRDVRGGEIPAFLERRLHGREIFGRQLNGFTVDHDAGRPRLTLAVGDEPDPAWLDVDEVRAEIALACGAAADELWQVRAVAPARRRLAAIVSAPPLGWTAVRPSRAGSSPDASVRAEGRRLWSDLLEVEVADDGTLRVNGVDGVARVVDGGDFGDTYNYAPPRLDAIVDRPESVAVEVASPGPLRGELVVRRSYRWPAGVRDDGTARTEETVPIDVETRVELRAGEPFVRLRVSFDNRCRDHRVRLHVPLPRRASGSSAEGQFAVVERALTVQGGFGETPVPTFPARGFVSAGGMAALLEHVLEYEVVDGRELALTILRSTGLISRNEHPWREDPAGPEVEVPDAQLIGQRSVALALFPHAGSWAEGKVADAAEGFQHPFLTAHGAAGAEDAAAGEEAGLTIRGEGVAMTSLRRRDGWLELRLLGQGSEPASASVTGDFREAREADLRGRPGPSVDVLDGRLSLPIGAWELRTLQLR